jgi:hypothetical protein
MMMLLTALLLATATTLPPIQQVPTGAPALQPNAGATQFTFVVAGDNRPEDASGGLTVPLKDIISKLTAAPPQFVVWNGDTVYGKTHHGIKDEYKQYLGAFQPLAAPLFNAPGNHELSKKIKCGKEKGESPSGKMLDDYQEAMGGPAGYFRYGNAAFVLVNTDEKLDVALKDECDYNGFVSQTQLSALQATLAQLDGDGTVAHIFLFMHRPIHDDNGHQIGTKKSNSYGNQVEAFRKAIDNGGYKKLLFVFASHDHRFFLYPAGASLSRTSPGSGGEPTFVVTGGAGAPLSGCKPGKSGRPGAYYHYVSVAVNGANVAITVNPLYGTTPCTQPPQ